MMEIAIPGIIIALIIFLFVRYRQNKSADARTRWEKEVEEAEQEYVVDGEITTEVPQYAFVFVKYRGVVFSMRIHEKADIWDKMSRKQRNEQLDAMKKAVKRGEVRVERFDENTVCYVPVKGDLKKIREDYNTFTSLGGKIEEDEI